jgi:hypothetical protein
VRRAEWPQATGHFLWLGPLLVLVGSISYFLAFARFPGLRDFPWVNLPVVVAGLAMSAWGMRRAFDPLRSRAVKILGLAGFGLSLLLALLFGAYIFYLSYQLPGISDAPQVLTVAPDFALPDPSESMVRLSDLRGQKVVVVFYRGHW